MRSITLAQAYAFKIQQVWGNVLEFGTEEFCCRWRHIPIFSGFKVQNWFLKMFRRCTQFFEGCSVKEKRQKKTTTRSIRRKINFATNSKSQRCQPLEISNLEISFRTSTLLPRKFFFFFFYLDPLPPSPTEQFRGKNVDLSVRYFNWLNTHPIRLSLM